jgi:hypothetical protein
VGIKAYSEFGSLSFEMQHRVESELDRDESMLWCGRQTLTKRHLLMTLPVAFFGMFFGGFALFWIVMAFTMTSKAGNGDVPFLFRYLFPLFGIPFLLVGLALMSSPFWATRRAKKTFYALTNKRAIVWQAGFFGGLSVRSFRADDLDDMIRIEHGDGRGDLIFREYVTTTYSHDHGRRHHLRRVGFIGIENVHDVERQVRETLLAEK